MAPLVAGTLGAEGKGVSFVGAVDPFVPQVVPVKPESDDVTMLLRLLGALLVQPPVLSEQEENKLREDAARAIQSSDTLASFFNTLLSRFRPDQLRETGRLGGGELAGLFMAGRELEKTASIPIAPPPLRTPVKVWWAQGRSPEDKATYSDWLNLKTENYEVPGDHYEAIRIPETLDAISCSLGERRTAGLTSGAARAKAGR